MASNSNNTNHNSNRLIKINYEEVNDEEVQKPCVGNLLFYLYFKFIK
jgi:hypothetical protein